jgi:hypothetical protein
MSTCENFQFHIIGAGRGGTSLIAGLVDAHPKFGVIMEQFSIPYLMGRKLTDAEHQISVASRINARIDNFLHACKQAAALSPDKIYGHKTTTEQIWGLESFGTNAYKSDRHEIHYSVRDFDALRCFAQRIADAKILFILRDGRTCVRSKMNRTGQTVEEATRRWKYSVRALNVLRYTCPRFHLLKFEDLIAYPEKELGEVCQFLGAEFDPAMLEGTKNPKIREEYRRSGFDSSVTSIVDSDVETLAEMREELIAFGYLR